MKDRSIICRNIKELSIIIAVFMLLICTACSVITQNEPVNTINFADLETKVSDISNIVQVKLSRKLSKTCTSYKFDYNVDGTTVEGYISIPLECNDSAPFKCILYNRGGNKNIGHLTDTDTAEISAATNRVVIASQYREDDEFGGKDLNDIIKLIDLCEQFDFIDMSDFCCAGVSRGGMMTYMAARADSRICRIISISGVSDLSAAYNEREDMKLLLKNFIGGGPEDLPSEYERRSAITFSDEIKIPTLIIHSTGDSQVSYKQAEDMYNALKKNGTDVTLKTRNDKVHGLKKSDAKVISHWLNKSDK